MSLTSEPVFPEQIIYSNCNFESWIFFSSTVPEVERQKPEFNRKTTESQLFGYRGQTDFSTQTLSWKEFSKYHPERYSGGTQTSVLCLSSQGATQTGTATC